MLNATEWVAPGKGSRVGDLLASLATAENVPVLKIDAATKHCAELIRQYGLRERTNLKYHFRPVTELDADRIVNAEVIDERAGDDDTPSINLCRACRQFHRTEDERYDCESEARAEAAAEEQADRDRDEGRFGRDE